MFVRQNQQQFRNSNADVQIFYGSENSGSYQNSWNKPIGVSNVYIMAIGAGGSGNGSTSGGGSGAVTVWYGAAQNVPDQLQIIVGAGGAGYGSVVRFLSGSTQINLVSANSTSTSSGAGATTANAFAASGFYQSITGQAGSSSGIAASSTTFLSGGAPAGGGVIANYGYTLGSAGSKSGFFLLQPIIVGLGGMGTGNGGIGCGGGVTGVGGQGMVLIASW